MNHDSSYAIVVAGVLLSICVSQVSPLIGENLELDTVKRRAASYAEIQFVDSESGRGIPLVELETVNGLKYVSDNAGRVAFLEPELMDRQVYFNAKSHGYEIPRDGFGYAGFHITPSAGKSKVIKLTRSNVAERLCRLTGEGKYRDSLLLGHEIPLEDSPHPGQVAGQDSVQAAVYRGRVYWFWGDTMRMDYPLGLFRMAGATTGLFDQDSPTSDPANGIVFDYFVVDTGFARAMMPLPERPQGVIWVGALFVVPDDAGNEKLVGHYSRRKGLEDEYEQGIAVFNDKLSIFESVLELPLTEAWRRPSGQPIPYEEGGKKWILFGSPNPNVRVLATLAAVLDPRQYEAFTCAKESEQGEPTEPQLGSDGHPEWRWQKELPPVDSKTEHQWIADGKIQPQDARFNPADAATLTERVLLHSGSVRWNVHSQKWILIACQMYGKSSLLGEVWYAEANEPTGPFKQAVHIVSHDKQTFYNVCQHPFLDRENGRMIYFEGTYANTFSGNSVATPRYNYNQILYRLDLNSARLEPARAN